MSDKLKKSFSEIDQLFSNNKSNIDKEIENKKKTIVSNKPKIGRNIPIKNPPTEEQEKVINCDADIIKVIALSGAGKTTTLTRYAKKRSKSKGLYIAFNKDIKEEASTKFHSNVKCVTSHGLAFAKFGVPIQHKLNLKVSFGDIFKYLKLFVAPDLQKTYVRILLKTVNNFVSSADLYINKKHIFYDDLNLVISNPKFKGHIPTDMEIIRDSEGLWKAMTDPNIPIFTTPDCYLKLMQLSGTKLNYDYIMLDEAQDSNPALINFLEQQDIKKIYVGDPHQSIYGFRNSVDAMKIAKADITLNLTGSFRFGESIADFANSLLATKQELLQLKGLGAESQVYNGSSNINYKDKETIAFISRTNAALFREAAEKVLANKKIYFSGGINNSGIIQLEQLYHLKYKTPGFKINDYILRDYQDFDEFKKVAEENKQIDWISRCKLVDEIGESLLQKIHSIKENSVNSPLFADQIFTTAHKSKGLEFDHVILADDFYTPSITIQDKNFISEDKYEDVNLLYVAATRAKKTVNINQSHFINWKNLSPLISNFLKPNTQDIQRLSSLYSKEVLAHLEKIRIFNSINNLKSETKNINIDLYKDEDTDPFCLGNIKKRRM